MVPKITLQMPKLERGTPKEIANRSKSKGLQKLRWYCEMCQKQCRDQNGFKCHLTSETHQRQLLLFAENSNQYLRQYSTEFKTKFIQLLRTSHGTKRVRANEVYQEYIRDKNHVHMNSTTWHTLTGFIHYLEKEGICHVDQTEKGWYIAYIDQEAVIRKEEQQKKAKAEKDDEERMKDIIDAQIERALELQGDVDEYKPSELIRGEDDEKVSISFANNKPTPEELARPTPTLLALSGSVFDRSRDSKDAVKKEPKKDDRKRSRSRSRDRDHKRSRDERDRPGTSSTSSRKSDLKKKSALDDIREMEEKKKERNNRKDHWLMPGIVVKVVTKKLPEYYKEKGAVKSLVDEYTAMVKMDDGTTIKLDQSHVETVVPTVGRQMIIVNGAYRGSKATLEAIREKDFAVELCISEGLLKGRIVNVPYEDASKMA